MSRYLAGPQELLPRRDGGVGLDAERGFLQVTSAKSGLRFS